MTTSDVIVIGAGAAGLAAAATLVKHGRSVCVIEARERIGGRILTRYDSNVVAPIELGAEFIHGRSAATMAWLARANVAMIDAGENRSTQQRGNLRQSEDMFGAMKRGLQRVHRPKKDLAFADFLEGAVKKHLALSVRKFARTLVEGFDAADVTEVSTLATLDEWRGGSAADAPTFRPQGGYEVLIRALHNSLPPKEAQLHLNTVVDAVDWTRGKVQVTASQFGRAMTFNAKQAIVTLPLGVLQLSPSAPNAVRFTPKLTQKNSAFAMLGAGPVVKIVLRFRRAFWETLDKGKYIDTAFFHCPGAAFPTFWTQLPLRTPLLVAWCGGPNAKRLAGCSEMEVVDAALDSAQRLFGTRVGVRDELQAAYSHDWQADRFALGAYSYVKVGGLNARQELAKPLRNTLFFAGEAAAVDEAATVGGAIRSGERAAEEALSDKRAR